MHQLGAAVIKVMRYLLRFLSSILDEISSCLEFQGEF